MPTDLSGSSGYRERQESDFDFVRTLVRQRTGIVLEDGKTYLVESRLAPLAHRYGLASTAALIAKARTEPGPLLISQIVEALTTNETSFFRDVAPFDALRDIILPALLRARAAERKLVIWCAASSSGQEPYSLAMLLRDSFPRLLGWQITFQATDISQEMLQRARKARYSGVEVRRGLSPDQLHRYFRQEGTEWVLQDTIRKMVEFRQLNLVESWPRLPTADIILLRNVLIYFDVPTKRRILGQAGRMLAPDGWLLLGGAETTINLDDSFERIPIERAGCFQLRSHLGMKVANSSAR